MKKHTFRFYDKDYKRRKYQSITLCTKCGDITDEKCCDADLILYRSNHTTFIDSIIPLYKEMNRV